MPKMNEPGKQIKVWLPQPIYDAIEQEARSTGRKMAEIAREEISQRYYPPIVEMSESGDTEQFDSSADPTE